MDTDGIRFYKICKGRFVRVVKRDTFLHFKQVIHGYLGCDVFSVGIAFHSEGDDKTKKDYSSAKTGKNQWI